MGGNSVDVEIMGHDFNTTTNLAHTIAEQARKIPGAEDIKISRDEDKSELQIVLDQDKLARHGLSTADVGSYLRNRIYGYRNSKFKEDGEEYDIIVRLDEKYRSSITDVENILITDGKGQKVRLKELGEIKEYFSPPNIERKSKQRILKVSITPAAGVALGEIAGAAQALIDNMEDIPQDVTMYIGGSFEDQQESFGSLSMLLLLSLMLVYIVMAAQFESLTYPFIIMFSLPFAFSGVLMALFFTNSTLSVMSLLGGIMLIGIVVKNGIVLIDYITLCRERGLAVLNSVVTAGKSRLRPVLMTTATTVLGMIPMAIGGGQGSEMWSPMAIAVIGGLTISTVLTLILIPTLYCVFAGTGIKNRRRKLRRQRELDVYFQANKDSIIKK